MSDPSEQLQALLQPAQSNTLQFAATSRYYGLPTVTRQTADGRTIVYLARRIVPPPERFEPLVEHTVTENQRLDHVAAKYLGDPEQFWRLCDANGALDAAELEELGRRIVIALPEGISTGASNA
jgi:hypothetical protein